MLGFELMFGLKLQGKVWDIVDLVPDFMGGRDNLQKVKFLEVSIEVKRHWACRGSLSSTIWS